MAGLPITDKPENLFATANAIGLSHATSELSTSKPNTGDWKLRQYLFLCSSDFHSLASSFGHGHSMNTFYDIFEEQRP